MPTIVPVSSPAPQTLGQSSGATAARDRAIQLLSGATPNVDQNNIKAEEAMAVKPPEDAVDNTRQNDTTEVTADDSKPKEETISSQYAVLARKEKAIRAKAIQQDQAFKAREAALTAREAELTTKATQDLTNYISKDKLKQNAYLAMQEAGVTYDELSQQALNAQSPEFQQMQAMREEMRQELQQLREEQGNTKKSLEQQQTQAYQQALNQIRTEAKDLVSTDPAYETIKATRSVNDVVELIERTFNEDGRLMTVEQAATAVEDHLVEEAMKLSQIKKIRARLYKNSDAAATQSNNAKPASSPGKNMTTLTNSVGSTRQLSARERALLAFKGELK